VSQPTAGIAGAGSAIDGPFESQAQPLHPLVATGSCLNAIEPTALQAPGLRRRPAIRRDGPSRQTPEGRLVEIVLVLLLLAIVVAIAASPIVRFVTVYDYQRGLRYRMGRFSGLVETGPHVSFRGFNEIRVMDARPTSITVPGQEILTSDGVALKVSLTARYVIADPVAAVTGDQEYVRALYVALQTALRDAIAGRSADDLLASRAQIGPATGAAVASDLARIGVELLGVDVRDVMVPGELKRGFAGIVAARREGEAALERARGETAALRALANAGRLVGDNPGLLQLRLLQQLESSSGNTIVLGWPSPDGRPPFPPGPPAPGSRGRASARPAADE
jgi:regulator of protease activity HflC (stomatin/prohibitin superfamily)